MEHEITIPAADITLEGLIGIPAEPARVGAVICHPHPLHGGEMRNGIVTALVKAFAAAGMATLRFNFRGVGQSGGVHDEGRGEIEDVTAAIGALTDGRSLASVVVVGYSFGAYVGLAAGQADPRVDKLIGVALPVARRDVSFLAATSKPLLLIAGDRDEIAPAAKLQEVAAGLAAPTSVAILEGADHFFRGREGDVARAATAFLAAG